MFYSANQILITWIVFIDNRFTGNCAIINEKVDFVAVEKCIFVYG